MSMVPIALTPVKKSKMVVVLKTALRIPAQIYINK